MATFLVALLIKPVDRWALILNLISEIWGVALTALVAFIYLQRFRQAKVAPALRDACMGSVTRIQTSADALAEAYANDRTTFEAVVEAQRRNLQDAGAHIRRQLDVFGNHPEFDDLTEYLELTQGVRSILEPADNMDRDRVFNVGLAIEQLVVKTYRFREWPYPAYTVRGVLDAVQEHLKQKWATPAQP